MAIWNGLPSWMGGQGSTSDTAAMDEHSDALVKQLQAQYQLANTAYNGLANQNQTAAMQNWHYQTASIYPTTSVTTGVATTTLPQYYPSGGTSVYNSTGWSTGHVYGATVMPSVMPQSPNVGDKMIMEFDGMNWNTRYEPALSGPKIAAKPENIEFSLDEIEEASQMIEKLSEKRLEHEAA